MKRIFLNAGVLLTTMVVAAAGNEIAVAGVSLSQNSGSRLVTVTYSLPKNPAIVTVDFLTNGVSVGEENFSNVAGDVNRLVTETNGLRTILWQPLKSWPDVVTTNFSVKVTAWPVEEPPDYLVVSLEKESVSDCAYYVSTNAFPHGGLSNDIYRTSRLVMRRIHAADIRWQMGATKADYTAAGSDESPEERETAHAVTLTYDYFIGIYPVTQEQYRLFTKASALGGYFTGYADSALRPRCGINYNGIRGSGTTTGHSSVTAGSAIGKLRAYTGIDFDLPSDAEWEYACKAGTTWLLYTGAAYTESNVKKLAWISSNSSSATQPVGRKLPNAWGLYDMIGNTLEWCRDYWLQDLGTNDVVNPVNTVYSSNRTMRGSRYNYKWNPYAHTTYRTSDIPNRSADQAKAYGFRVMCPVTLKFGK